MQINDFEYLKVITNYENTLEIIRNHWKSLWIVKKHQKQCRKEQSWFQLISMIFIEFLVFSIISNISCNCFRFLMISCGFSSFLTFSEDIPSSSMNIWKLISLIEIIWNQLKSMKSGEITKFWNQFVPPCIQHKRIFCLN